MGGWGIAPLARSTPTLWAYAQRNAHKDTPKKSKESHSRLFNQFSYLCMHEKTTLDMV
ncbi:MAG: hypothetical protein NZ455_03945 [Bacteroidia bacterium]|nr:hypothetical protein [Bacteroidia bacterium]